MPRWGRGRVDTFNPYKAIQFNWPIDRLPHEELIGASDFPSLWNQKPREGLHLHWDGDNDSVDERNLSAALGAGVTPVTVDHARSSACATGFGRCRRRSIRIAIDRRWPRRGAPLYRQLCVSVPRRPPLPRRRACPGRRASDRSKTSTHPHRSRIGSIRIRTCSPPISTRSIPSRNTASRTSARHMATRTIRSTASGRARPYLHNGSVPTLLDLMNAPERAAEVVLSRLRRLRPEAGGFRLERARGERSPVLPVRHVGRRQQQRRP